MRLTWANGLLALATDVAAGLAHLHELGLHHGRWFLFNVMITSAWRAKLSEYALSRFLALSNCGQSEASGYHSLPSAHGEKKEQLAASIFIPPEKFSGKMQGVMAAVQPQRLPAAMGLPRAKAVAHEPQSRDVATGLLGRVRARRSTGETLERLCNMATRQRNNAANPTTPRDAQADEPHPEPEAMVRFVPSGISVIKRQSSIDHQLAAAKPHQLDSHQALSCLK